MVCVENKTIKMSMLLESKANNKSNDENRCRWLKKGKKKNSIDGDRNNGPSK